MSQMGLGLNNKIMNKNINILLNSLQDLDAFSDELERLEGEEYEKGLWDSTRPYSDVYDSLHMIYNYFPKTKEELQEIIKERLIDAKQEDPNKIVNLNDIDVSKITDMSELFHFDEFRQSTAFVFNNVDISMWDVSNVENMNSMFDGCINFNCDLSKWNVSNVEKMNGMFCECKSFKSDLKDWDVSNVRDMGKMFYKCKSFNADLSGWKVSNVKDMSEMFWGCASFKSNLKDWKVNNVEDMGFMFSNCKSFNSDLSEWKDKVSNVKDMDCMFYNCTSFNSDLSGWNVSKVKYMDRMFYGCTSFTADLSEWKVPKVSDHDYFNYYDVVDENGQIIGRDILPNLPNKKCPKWTY